MNQVFVDDAGNIVCIPTIEPYYRNAVPPPRRPRRPRRPRPYPRPSGPVFMPPMVPHYPQQPTPPVVVSPPTTVSVPAIAGPNLQTGLKALAAVLPGAAQVIGAFRRAPGKPTLSGNPEQDLPNIVDFIADVFEHGRTNDQMVGVLATTGAILEILGDL